MISKIDTHLEIDKSLCGTPVHIEKGKSRVKLELTENMKADSKDLIHGGFIFGLADYAAMIAVNHENVVLASAECKFLKPSAKGEILIADAEVIKEDSNRFNIAVSVFSNDEKVFKGEFFAVIAKDHVLG